MRPETSFDSVGDTAAELNRRFASAPAERILGYALDTFGARIAVVSSFGAESVVLLHMLSRIDRHAPVLFVDSEMLFSATLRYQREVADTLGLTGVRRVTPDRERTFRHDPDGDLHRRDPDLCCHLRKTEPLGQALRGFDAWVTGRKRFQTLARRALDVFEVDAEGRIKVNPVAGWGRGDVQDYLDRHALPRHPLVAEGFASIGCWPCTSRVAPGEDPRSGRWRGREKDECGIHLVNGRWVRTGVPG